MLNPFSYSAILPSYSALSFSRPVLFCLNNKSVCLFKSSAYTAWNLLNSELISDSRILISKGEEIAKPNINAMIIRGSDCKSSFLVMESVPSPLPVLEIIKRSRLKITSPHTTAKTKVAI